jgi:hypothetical protein
MRNMQGVKDYNPSIKLSPPLQLYLSIRETITVDFGDECSPVKEVKYGVVKLTHVVAVAATTPLDVNV